MNGGKPQDPPLLIAAAQQPSTGSLETVKALLMYNANVNSVTAEGETAANLVCQWSECVPVLEVLLEQKADVNLMDDNDDTPWSVAAAVGEMEVMQLLLTKGGVDVNKPNSGGETPLCLAVANCVQDNSKITELLQMGADVNKPDSTSEAMTPLHHAISNRDTEMVEFLLVECKALPNVTSKDGKTPLLQAVMGMFEGQADTDLVRLLLQAKADPNRCDNLGQAPLLMAASSDQPNLAAGVVNVLLAARADPSVKSQEDSGTALHEAAANGHLRVVEMLMRAQAMINVKNRHNETPLDAAIMGHKDRVMALLKKHGARCGREIL